MSAAPAPAPAAGAPTPRLGPLRKSTYALGDVTLNTALSALTIVYAQYFLVQIADVRAVLAGAIPLIGRTIDAFFDPLMGSISDRTRWRAGRRRPWFLIGALPYGLFFALMWADPPFASPAARFAYYALAYTLMNLSMSVLTVPYLAIQPEMALEYDARTSLNTYRTFGSMLGIFGAVLLKPVAESFGGDAAGFALAGAIYGVLIALPWLAVYAATFERPAFRTRGGESSLRESVLATFRHPTFVKLTLIYIMGRIAMDLAGTLLVLYVTFWLGRPGDFELTMGLFLLGVLFGLPAWWWLARGRDKSQVFIAGSLWWMLLSFGLAAVQPDWPRWMVLAYVPLVGFGFAVVDVMPWSMLGEVIDEDDLLSGERREGLYNGMFGFLRKLGGALGVFLVLGLLDLLGYEKGAQQSETARQAIRWMTAASPAAFLLIGIWLARDYPLTRARHDEIVTKLALRERPST
jgi:sugar (glycoside-pentoside-hexuronide) transporter